MNEPKSVTETRVTHDVHRRATTLLAEAAGRAPLTLLAEFRGFLVQTLHHHHETEDNLLWPIITADAPAIAEPLRALSGEHDQLDAALDKLGSLPVDGDHDRAALGEAAEAVRSIIFEHLGHEEPLLFPALREHVTPEQWDEFSAKVIASSPQEGAHLLIGLYDRVGTPDEVELILSGLPEPAKAVLPMLREQADNALRALGA